MEKSRTRKRRTNTGKYSFVNKKTKSWNQLPAVLLLFFPCKITTFRKMVQNVVISKWIQVEIELYKWSVVILGDVTWYKKWFRFDVKWPTCVTMKFLGTNLTCILLWPFTEGTWLYCVYFMSCVSWTVFVLTCLVVCGWVCLWLL